MKSSLSVVIDSAHRFLQGEFVVGVLTPKARLALDVMRCHDAFPVLGFFADQAILGNPRAESANSRRRGWFSFFISLS
jgi:hypothetical protein